MQLALLQSQLGYCGQQVAFYQELFNSLGFDPSKFSDLTMLERLPVLSKADVRKRQSDFRGRSYQGDKVHKSFSSGSTGEPFASYFDRLAWYRKKYLCKLRARMACGMKLSQRVAILECEEKDKLDVKNQSLGFLSSLMPMKVISMFQSEEAILQELARFKAENIYAYPSHLFQIANNSNPNQAPLIPGLQRIFTSSEFLEQNVRQFVEQRFGVPIYDHYGSTEFKEIAWQCKEQRWYHVNYDEVICEVVDDAGNPVLNEAGRVLITDLRNKAMPLLRFELGDIGVLTNDPCQCGYKGDSFRPMGGRASDNLKFGDNREVSAYQFTTAIEEIPGLRQYQIVQTSIDELIVNVICEPDAASNVEGLAKTVVSNVLANAGEYDQVKVTVERCDHIAPEPNNKLKVIKCMIKQ